MSTINIVYKNEKPQTACVYNDMTRLSCSPYNLFLETERIWSGNQETWLLSHRVKKKSWDLELEGGALEAGNKQPTNQQKKKAPPYSE